MSLNKVDALYLFVNDNILLRGGKENIQVFFKIN